VNPKQASRIAAYREIDDKTVYWMGDLTESYPQLPRVMKSFWGQFDPKIYGKQSLPFLTYMHRHCVFHRGDQPFFALYDTIGMDDSKDAQKARVTWLYHIWQDVPVKWDMENHCLQYTVDNTEVAVYLWALNGSNDFEYEVQDLGKEKGAANPITGEDYRNTLLPMPPEKGPKQMAHNFWFTGEKGGTQQWLAVIVPWRSGASAPKVRRASSASIQVNGVSADFSGTGKKGIIINAHEISDEAVKQRTENG
jgi:hypothetical protein